MTSTKPSSASTMSKVTSNTSKSVSTRTDIATTYDHFLQNIASLQTHYVIYKSLYFYGTRSLLDLLELSIEDIQTLEYTDINGNCISLHHGGQGLVCALNAYIRYLVRDRRIKLFTSITQSDFNMYCHNTYNAPEEFEDLTYDDFYTDIYEDNDQFPSKLENHSSKPSIKSNVNNEECNDPSLHFPSWYIFMNKLHHLQMTIHYLTLRQRPITMKFIHSFQNPYQPHSLILMKKMIIWDSVQ